MPELDLAVTSVVLDILQTASLSLVESMQSMFPFIVKLFRSVTPVQHRYQLGLGCVLSGRVKLYRLSFEISVAVGFVGSLRKVLDLLWYASMLLDQFMRI